MKLRDNLLCNLTSKSFYNSFIEYGQIYIPWTQCKLNKPGVREAWGLVQELALAQSSADRRWVSCAYRPRLTSWGREGNIPSGSCSDTAGRSWVPLGSPLSLLNGARLFFVSSSNRPSSSWGMASTEEIRSNKIGTFSCKN